MRSDKYKYIKKTSKINHEKINRFILLSYAISCL